MKEIRNVEEFKKEIISREGRSFVDFKTSWCRHCKLMQPLLEEAEKEYGERIFFFSVDVEEVPELPGAFELVGTPTFIAFEKGKEIGRIVGYNQRSTFVQEMKKIFGDQ